MATLDDIDFGAAWKEMNAARREPDDAAYWDGRAKSFASNSRRSSYSTQFIEFMGLEPQETVLDMGCGSGSLALPLSKAGHKVMAVDFSAGMLAELANGAALDGTENHITAIQASWEDDWQAAGVPVCDVAVASRSIVVSDLEAALDKLVSFARRRVCITMPLRDSPRFDPVIFESIGRTHHKVSEVMYCLGILLAKNYNPEMRLIITSKNRSYDTREEAIENARMSVQNMTPEEEQRFAAYCEKYIVAKTDNEGNTGWVRDYDCKTYWAFISWDL